MLYVIFESLCCLYPKSCFFTINSIKTLCLFPLLLCLKLTVLSLFLSLLSSVHKLQEDVELEWLRQTEVLYYRLERSHSNAALQLKHNPWSLKCQQQHLQKMKENAKHRNQYSILSPIHNLAAVF